jgi:YtxH-like protein
MRAADMIPNRDALIDALSDALGLRRDATTAADAASMLMIFAAGALVGTALALLFAPRSGQELRADLRERASDVRRRAAGETERMERPQPLKQM